MAKTVQIINKFVNFEDGHRHTQGESNVEIYDITGPRYHDNIDLLSLTWFVRATHPNYDTLINKQVVCAESSTDPEQICITWSVDGDFTAYAGELQVQFVGKSESGQEIIKLQSSGLMIKASVEGAASPPQDMFEQTLAQMEQLTNDAANASRFS